MERSTQENNQRGDTHTHTANDLFRVHAEVQQHKESGDMGASDTVKRSQKTAGQQDILLITTSESQPQQPHSPMLYSVGKTRRNASASVTLTTPNKQLLS